MYNPPTVGIRQYNLITFLYLLSIFPLGYMWYVDLYYWKTSILLWTTLIKHMHMSCLQMSCYVHFCISIFVCSVQHVHGIDLYCYIDRHFPTILPNQILKIIEKCSGEYDNSRPTCVIKEDGVTMSLSPYVGENRHLTMIQLLRTRGTLVGTINRLFFIVMTVTQKAPVT